MLSTKVSTSRRTPLYLNIVLQLASLCVADVQPVTKVQVANQGKGRPGLVCPPPNHRPDSPETLLLDLLPCKTKEDCPLHKDLGILCCKAGNGQSNRCRYGIIPPKPKPTHLPILGIQRHCPDKDPLAEFLPIKNCTSDNDCWPRICCDDYCRTPDLPKIIAADSSYTTLTNLRYAAEYLQCTPPPRYDFFRKTCLSIRDCFPLICCQEREAKVCRPAKKSLLPLIATFVQEAVDG
ncbi:uncharacterized protein [Hetaerina americana]|uniref:uncharacterized protein isoform X2 n=1 Tax=Hetaerina americana TaxID=62018 RepID=UPI003A7F3DE8